jgi:hypothetical protein
MSIFLVVPDFQLLNHSDTVPRRFTVLIINEITLCPSVPQPAPTTEVCLHGSNPDTTIFLKHS